MIEENGDNKHGKVNLKNFYIKSCFITEQIITVQTPAQKNEGSSIPTCTLGEFLIYTQNTKLLGY